MKLRGQLVLSHLASIFAAAVLIGAVTAVVLLRSTRGVERQSMEAALTTASHVLSERVSDLQQSGDTIAAMAAFTGALPDNVETTGRLHDILVLHRLERIEVFQGLTKEVEAYRWERGADPALATTWLPSDPSIAAKVASGRPAMWVQRSPNGTASLKLCAAIRAAPASGLRWVVLTEPLDEVLLGRILPPQAVGALEERQQIVVAWPETPRGPNATLRDLGGFLATGGLPRLLSPILARRPSVQLDDGNTLDVGLMAAPVVSAETLMVGLRAWFLLIIAGALLAVALGSGIASRLLAPLQALLEGTAAMARGHLMVRLPTQRADELGALTHEFNRMADEIRNTYVGVISTLAEVVEAKSHYTREHIERVERLTMATADMLERRGWVRFSSHQRFVLSVAAILHDVGKISIANEILNKSGPLSGQERAQILSHPEVGALIVERMGKLDRAAEIIRCAHEHFDGSGYPRGLKGEEIPLESRIILVVDAFDAMTMARPYSTTRSLEGAISELRGEAGRQFDPVVVEAFVEVISTNDGAANDAQVDSGLYRTIHADSDPALRVSGPPRVGPG